MNQIILMPYRQYKQHYADCQTVKGSYNTYNKTIKVIIPDGRMKKSGVRGERFHGYILYFIDKKDNKVYRCSYRAVSKENAMKQHLKNCKANDWIPCECNNDNAQTIFL